MAETWNDVRRVAIRMVAWVVLAGIGASCSGTNAPPGNDGGGSCGAMGEVCCKGTVCNAGLSCGAGVCE